MSATMQGSAVGNRRWTKTCIVGVVVRVACMRT